MQSQHWLARINAHRLLQGMLYVTLLGAGLQETALSRLGTLLLIAVAVAFAGLLVVVTERSRRCLD